MVVPLLQCQKWRNKEMASFEMAQNRTGVILKESSKCLCAWGGWGLTAVGSLCFIDIGT